MKDGIDSDQGSIHGKTPQERLLKGMNALIKHRQAGRVHYTQSAKRMTIVRNHLIPPFSPSRVIWEDCSSAVTGLWYMAGLHDPNDFHYNGQGYTGTLCLHGKRVYGKAKVGDLVFYGSGGPPWKHVAVVYSVGNGVKVWSHGHEGGPVIEAIDYRSDRGQLRRYF